jgi:hypothetical protein
MRRTKRKLPNKMMLLTMLNMMKSQLMIKLILMKFLTQMKTKIKELPKWIMLIKRLVLHLITTTIKKMLTPTQMMIKMSNQLNKTSRVRKDQVMKTCLKSKQLMNKIKMITKMMSQKMTKKAKKRMSQ